LTRDTGNGRDEMADCDCLDSPGERVIIKLPAMSKEQRFELLKIYGMIMSSPSAGMVNP
jgi:hypothetical protein